MFSLEQLLFAVASDVRTNAETLEIILPMITEVYERDLAERELIKVSIILLYRVIVYNILIVNCLLFTDGWCYAN